jgi:hypothetical protein
VLVVVTQVRWLRGKDVEGRGCRGDVRGLLFWRGRVFLGVSAEGNYWK